MPNKRLGRLGLIVGAAALLAVACGGGDAVVPVPASQPTVAPTATAAPTSPADPTSDSNPGAATTAGKYTWEVSEVDGAGAKPSIAVGASGTPYIAFTSEDMPGFVKSAVLHAGT